jgi:hypothetical protein
MPCPSHPPVFNAELPKCNQFNEIQTDGLSVGKDDTLSEISF